MEFGLIGAAIFVCWAFYGAPAILAYFRLDKEAGKEIIGDAEFIYTTGLVSMIGFIPLAFIVEAFVSGRTTDALLYSVGVALFLVFFFFVIKKKDNPISTRIKFFFLAYLVLELYSAFMTPQPGTYLAKIAATYVLALYVTGCLTVALGFLIGHMDRKRAEFYGQAMKADAADASHGSSSTPLRWSVPYALAFVVIFSLAINLSKFILPIIIP